MRKRGFTLIELLVVSSIMAVLLGGVYLAFSTGLFGYKDTVAALEYDGTAGRMLSQLAQDLRNIIRYSDADTGFKGDAASIEFFSLTDSYKAGVSFMEFSRLCYVNKEGIFMRFIGSGKRSILRNSTGLNEDMELNVKDISFSYGFFDETRDTMKWQEKWDNNRRLPSAVKLTLSPGAASRQDYEISVYLPQ